MMRLIMFFAAALLLAYSMTSYAADVPVQESSVMKGNNAIVVELFTSQYYSTDPPAQKFLGDLAKRKDVIALEWHVTLWDRSDWKDTLGKSAWTVRGGRYAEINAGDMEALSTPLMAIDGKLFAVGSDREMVEKLINEAKSLRTGKFEINVAYLPKGRASVTVDGPKQSKAVTVALVRLWKEVSTDIKGGKNAGTTQVSHNVVEEMHNIGTWSGGKQSFNLNEPPLKDNETCAVLLQDDENMHILAAGVCDSVNRSSPLP